MIIMCMFIRKINKKNDGLDGWDKKFNDIICKDFSFGLIIYRI